MLKVWKEKRKNAPLIRLIEKALIENTSKSSNISENRRRKLRRAMIFLEPHIHLSDTEELKDDVTFNSLP